MVKAVFLDFYGMVVHEDGEVFKKITKIIMEIFKTGKINFTGTIYETREACSWVQNLLWLIVSGVL